MELIDLSQVLKLIAALAFVVALMGGLGLMLKKLGYAQGQIKSRAAGRLRIIESLPLDPRRRAVLIACDDKEHLVILGANGETVIRTDINPAGPDERDAP